MPGDFSHGVQHPVVGDVPATQLLVHHALAGAAISVLVAHGPRVHYRGITLAPARLSLGSPPLEAPTARLPRPAAFCDSGPGRFPLPPAEPPECSAGSNAAPRRAWTAPEPPPGTRWRCSQPGLGRSCPAASGSLRRRSLIQRSPDRTAKAHNPGWDRTGRE